MHRAMSSRTVCTSEADASGYKYMRDSAVSTKVRRTRKAPDFYSPENASKCSARAKKSNSDDNDSWKPESETDEVNSESETERSNGRRDKSGIRRRMFLRNSSPEAAEMEADEQPLPSEQLEETAEKQGLSSDTDVEEKSPKEAKREGKNKEKRLKGCRELQDLLDGCAQVHKESRTRRLAPRRENSRTVQTNAHSASTWSNGSSRVVTDKDSGNQKSERKRNLQSSSKQPSSLNTSSAREVQKTADSSFENPLTAEVSDTMEDDSKPTVSTRRATQNAKINGGATCTRRSKTTTMETASESSVRAKRPRVDVDTSQMRKMTKGVENGTKASSRDVTKEDVPVIKLPRMPMIRYGEYWFRARIKEETRESVFVEFTGFEDGAIKPFWIRKDSVDVFKGSYSGKDWKHVGEGAWEPRPRKTGSRKQTSRGGRRAKRRSGTPKTTDAREQSKLSQEYTDQAYTGDSEKCSKPTAAVLGGNRDRVYYRKSSGDGQERGCLEKMRSGDSVVKVDPSGGEDKNMDCGSQSEIHAKPICSEDSFPDPDVAANTQQLSIKEGEEGKCKNDVGQEWIAKTASGNSPSSRNAATSGSSHPEEGPLNKTNKTTENNRKEHSSSGGNEHSEERMPTRLRRKPGKVIPTTERQEEEKAAPPRAPKALRRSTRLCPKGPWRYKDDSSSDAEYDDDSLNTPGSRRNGSALRPSMSKYVTRSVRNSESGRRNSGTLSASQPLPRAVQIPKTHRTSFPPGKKTKKTAALGRGDMKDAYYEEEYEEIHEREGSTDIRFHRSRSENAASYRPLEKMPSVSESVDGLVVWNLGVNVSSQIRKYLPYYSHHIPDVRLSAFVELMERLDGIGMKSDAVQRPVSETPALRPVHDSAVKAVSTEHRDKIC